MHEYLSDIDFLTLLDKANVKTHYAKIILLSFDEKLIKEILGVITSGSMSVNTSSAVRRTISLSMIASFENSGLTNIDNEISVNKKIKILVGLNNPFRTYAHYGDIIWFPCGIYIISTASVLRSTTGWSISITGKDKMALLDGTVGGILPASITFHERKIKTDDGNYKVEHPTIFQIIYEAVNHWGGEIIENIIISDVEETCKLLVKYTGEKPIYFSDNYESMDFNESKDYPHKYVYGQDVGYKETPFTYPRELILKGGDSVVTLLNKITDVLGNYEFFYNLDGKFVFLEIKNYLNTGSPLTKLTFDNYTKSYSNSKYLYSLTELDTTTAITVSPKYDLIKNDFYVWGKKKTLSGMDIDIRYHLAIDTKPDIDLAGQYMWEIKKDNEIVGYEFTEENSYNNVSGYRLIGPPCDEWREELYRRALFAQVTTGVSDNYYDSELIAEWRSLYDPTNKDWANNWNPAVFNEPKALNYWLDFIDTGSEVGKYSVKLIGRRTKVVSSDDIKTIYNIEAPDIIFIEGIDLTLITRYRNIGLKYFILTPEYNDLFDDSATGASCFDKIRELMYQHLSYNTTITINCLPKYYIEPNNIIHIEDRESNICGNYLITLYNVPLTYSGTMSITATEVLTRI